MEEFGEELDAKESNSTTENSTETQENREQMQEIEKYFKSAGNCPKSSAKIFNFISLLGPGSPTSENFTAIHSFYLLIFLLIIASSYALFHPAIKIALAEKFFCSSNSNGTLTANCQMMLPYSLIYRIYFACSIFFFILCTLFFAFPTYSDLRLRVHSGFWIPKFAFLAIFVFCAFSIPRSGFGFMWMYFGMAGSFFYTLIQFVFLVDAAKGWNEFLTNTMKEATPTFWNFLRLLSAGAMYASSAIVVVLLFIFYSEHDSCKTNLFLLTGIVSLCLLSIIISFTLDSYSEQLLQTSFVTMYTTYLTYASLRFGQSECSAERDYSLKTGNEPDLI